MKKRFILFVLLVPFLNFAQKEEIKLDEVNNNVLVDGKVSFKLQRVDCGFVSANCHFDAFDLQENKVFVINLRSYNSPTEVSNTNPKGTVTYYEFVFLDSKQKTEISYVGIKTEKIARTIVTNKLFEHGSLNEKAVSDFVLVNGTPYKDRIKF